MKQIIILSLCLTFFACNSAEKRTTASQEVSRSPWFTENLTYNIKNPLFDDVQLRAGYYVETVPLKGCVMYLEGLADSVANQTPLFAHLSRNGYRVIFFDYMGQGGSEGSMNNSRIVDPANTSLQISTQAKLVWDKYANMKDEINGQSCAGSKKVVMGWSTGGLAAYTLVHEGWAEAVALVAPGIHVNAFIGEAATQKSLMLNKNAQTITVRTLTRNTFANTFDPHVDPIKPITPTAIPLFAMNLKASSLLAQHWKVPATIPGIVFLSGTEDTYVDRNATAKTLAKNAPHFQQVKYDGALHELQNEMPEVSADLYARLVGFLDAFTGTAGTAR